MFERFDKFFKTPAEKEAEAEKILQLLRESPDLEARLRECDEKRVAEVRELLSKREVIEREKAETMSRLQAEVAEKQVAKNRIIETLNAATRALDNAEHERLSVSLTFSEKLSNIDDELIRLAPSEIDEFVYEMISLGEKTRRELSSEQRPGKKNWAGRVTSAHFFTNREAVERKQKAVREAIAEAQGMKLKALSHDDIIRRLDELKVAIPDAKDFETVTIELPDALH